MPLNILIVDDDKNFAETLQDSLRLKKVDAVISGAGTAHEALSILAREVPSAIILDIQLPDMNGVEFVKVIRASARLKDIPVLFISAKYTEPADRSEAMLAGASAFFSKPADVDELWRELKYLVDRKK